jgi:lytic transglycosylase catalytic
MALNFRQPSNTIVTQDKYSRLHIDSRTTSIFKKTFKVTKFGAKVGFKSAELVGKTSYDVLKQQIKAPADSRNNNDTLADSQGGAVKTSLKNASSLGRSTGTSIGKKVGTKVDGKVNNAARKALGQPTKAQVNNLTSRVVGARSKRQARRKVYKELATGKTAPRRVARRVVNWAARSVSGIISKIIGLIVGKISGAVFAICIALLLVMVVVSLISSFLPAWLTGEEEAAAKKQQSSVAVAGVVANGMGNDYPYKDQPFNEANNATGYYFGNCTDFVIWRVNRDDGVLHEPWKHVNRNTTPSGGNGYQWGLPTALPGWVTTDKPSPGDIISFQPGSQGGRWHAQFGHVAYIGQVSVNGSITVENYGTNEYFVTNYTADALSQLVSTGQAIIKHNPNSKVKIKKIGGSSVVDPGGGYKGVGGPLTPDAAKAAAKSMLPAYGWDEGQYQCLETMWTRESNWNYAAENPGSGAYGIPQSLPADKMGSIAPDWRTNAVTQIKWGLGYIKERYGSPCQAWDFWQAHNWY